MSGRMDSQVARMARMRARETSALSWSGHERQLGVLGRFAANPEDAFVMAVRRELTRPINLPGAVTLARLRSAWQATTHPGWPPIVGRHLVFESARSAAYALGLLYPECETAVITPEHDPHFAVVRGSEYGVELGEERDRFHTHPPLWTVFEDADWAAERQGLPPLAVARDPIWSLTGSPNDVAWCGVPHIGQLDCDPPGALWLRESRTFGLVGGYNGTYRWLRWNPPSEDVGLPTRTLIQEASIESHPLTKTNRYYGRPTVVRCLDAIQVWFFGQAFPFMAPILMIPTGALLALCADGPLLGHWLSEVSGWDAPIPARLDVAADAVRLQVGHPIVFRSTQWD